MHGEKNHPASEQPQLYLFARHRGGHPASAARGMDQDSDDARPGAGHDPGNDECFQRLFPQAARDTDSFSFRHRDDLRCFGRRYSDGLRFMDYRSKHMDRFCADRGRATGRGGHSLHRYSGG